MPISLRTRPQRDDAHEGGVRLSFDAGTVVVEGTSGPCGNRIPGLLWDPRVDVYRAPAYKYTQVRTAFERRGVPVEDEIALPFAAVQVRQPDLRPYQKDALLAWEMAVPGDNYISPLTTVSLPHERGVESRANRG